MNPDFPLFFTLGVPCEKQAWGSVAYSDNDGGREEAVGGVLIVSVADTLNRGLGRRGK